MRLLLVPRASGIPTLTTAHLWAVAMLVAIFASCTLTGIWVGDFWWHLKVGEVIATTRQIPAVDTFSFTAAGQPYVYQQWLGELYLYFAYRLGGVELVAAVNALIITATALLVLLAAWEASRDLRIASATTLVGIFIALPNRDARPQTLGFLFFALFYLLLMRFRRGAPVPLWLLPLLAIVWANVHGSVLVGFALILLVFCAELLKARLRLASQSALSRRKLVALGVVTAAVPPAMLLNPFGVGLFDYFLTIQRNPVIQTMVTEWFAPSFRNTQDIPFFLALLACVAILALSPKPMDVTDAVLFVAFTALALQAVRNSPWFGIVAAPLVARQLAAALEHYRKQEAPQSGKPRRGVLLPRSELSANYLFAGLLLALAVLASPWGKPHLPLPDRVRGLVDPETPVGAVRFVATRLPQERFFHTGAYGGYLIWTAPAGPRVFVDGRVELYPRELWQDYSRISMAIDWEQRLDKYGIRHVLLPKRPPKDFQRPLLAALATSPDWQRLYEDEQAIVYGKR